MTILAASAGCFLVLAQGFPPILAGLAPASVVNIVPVAALSSLGALLLAALSGAAAMALYMRRALRRLAHQTLEEQAQLQLIFDNLTEGIMVVDTEGRVVQLNRAAVHFFGADERAGNLQQLFEQLVVTESGGEVIPSEQRPAAIGLRGVYLENREIEIRNVTTGQASVCSVNTAPIRNRAGELAQVIVSYRDVTEHKQDEQVRRQLEHQLRQSQKMQALGQLTGGVAHDFNNLLGIVIGNLDLLERQLSGRESYLTRVRHAQQAAARGADLTRRLLSFASREDLSPSPALLDETIENTIALSRTTLGPEIRIMAHIEKKLPPVFVDVPGLESALLNLVVNARDAMPHGGQLTISAELCQLHADYPPVKTGEIEAGPYACVTVTDTGIGMSPGVIERAFEPFFTTKPRGKGTGLGLAMVYGFVRQSGGTVRLYSEIGYGTTVSLYLPLGGAPAELVRSGAAREQAAKQSGKVLIVDDEIALLEVAGVFLEEMGFTTLQAENAARALYLAQQHDEIDLLITDIVMPGGVNGIELAEQIRTRYPHIKVIFTSGFPADVLAERGQTTLDGPLLQKPYQRSEFTALVRKTMPAVEAAEGQ